MRGSSGERKKKRAVRRRAGSRLLTAGRALAILTGILVLAGIVLVPAQQSRNSSANLSLQISPAIRLTNTSTTASLWIRLGTAGAGRIWGSNSNSCTSPIAGATSVASSGKFSYPLSSIPFTTSDAYICALDPANGAALTASAVWPHTDQSLSFSQQPTNAAAGSSISPAVTVKVFDSNGVWDTTSSASVTVAITSGTGTSGATLNGTLTQTAVNGVATFSNLSINKDGSGYTLTATSSGLTSAASSSFNITSGSATQLVFTTQPGGGTAGQAWTTQPVVTLEDASGNPVTGTAQNVTLAIQNNAGGGTLSGTTTVAVNTSTGQATFTNLSINKSGTGYTLTATGSTVDTTAGTVISGSFTVTAATASQLVWTTQPSSSANPGAAFGTQPAVEVEDTYDNPVLSGLAVTLSISTGTGNSAGTLSCTTNPVTSSVSTGIATFAGCSISASGTGYTLKATTSSPSLTSAASNAITINGPTKLVFTAEPSAGALTAGACSTLTITSQNSGGTATNPTSALTVNLASGHAGGTFYSGSGCSGVITSTSIGTGASAATVYYQDTAATSTGFTLTASTTTLPGITTATSNSYTVTAAAISKFAITGSGTQTAGASQQLTVTAQDTYGNTATTYTGSHSLTFSGASAAPAGNNPTVTNSSGTATNFGTSTAITFTAGVSSAGGSMVLYDAQTATVAVTDGTHTSSGAGNLSVTVSAATASKLVFTTAPITVNANTCSGTVGATTVTSEDQYSNISNVATTQEAIGLGGQHTTFYSNSNCATSESSTHIAIGSSSATFYFDYGHSGPATLTITANGTGEFSSAPTQAETIN